VSLERDPLSLVNTNEELLGRKSSASGVENREYGLGGPLCWPRNTYPQKLELTSPTSSGRSVGIVRSRTQATEYTVKHMSTNRRSIAEVTISSHCLEHMSTVQGNATSSLDLTMLHTGKVAFILHFVLSSSLSQKTLQLYFNPRIASEYTYLALLLFTQGRAVLHRSLKSGELWPTKKRTQTSTLSRSNQLCQHYVPSVLLLHQLDNFVCFD
jgi:hypothetical protein